MAKAKHLNTFVGNFQSLKGDYFSIGKRYFKEPEKTFSSIGARSRERKFHDGDIVGIMKWIYGEVEAFKGIFYTREDGARSTNSVLLKVGYGHLKTCLDPDFEVSMESVRRSTIEALEWRNFLSDI